MRIFFTFSVLMLVSTLIMAQQRTISGSITSADDGAVLPGVSVVVTGTTTGTITNTDGKYQIVAPNEGGSLTFSFIGMETQVVNLDNRNVYDIVMKPETYGVDEVVVTALGIEKKSRSLTYSTQQVGADELTRTKDVNMINSLSGKSAGLVIGKSAAGVGGSSRVIIRGNKSISGENQPLYVIDGIPINNSSFGQIGGSELGGTIDGGDAISNINPEDVESINVLKGAAASALYGSMGQNGVILITTKKGKAGVTNVEISTTTSVESALTLPELQGGYGATTAIDPTSNANDPSTWGAKNNGSITTDDLRGFFKKGITSINSASVTSGNEKNQFYMSYANTSAKGIVESNDLTKHNFMINGNSKINDKLSIDGSANLISQTVNNRPYVGFYSNPAGEAYLYGGSGSDFAALKDNYKTWDPVRNISSQVGPYKEFNTTNFILDNPYWTINMNPNKLKRTRSIFTGGLKWDIMDGLNFRLRSSVDHIEDQFEQDVYATSSNIIWDDNGGYDLMNTTTNQFYSDMFLNYTNNKLGDVTINATLGSSNNYTTGYYQEFKTVKGQNNFVATNVFSLTNLQGAFTHSERSEETLLQSAFGTATVGYKNAMFLDVTGRQEWASTIDESFFYPSVGGSIILSEFTGTSNTFSFAKIRGTYSEVGNSLPYGVNNGPRDQYWTMRDGTIKGPENGVPILEDGTSVELKPERSKSLELGANVRLFNNSIDFDFTFYKNNIENQYFKVTAPLGAYVPNFYVNAGEIQNSGVEMSLGYKYAPGGDFKYETKLNYSLNKNKVISVNDEAGLDSYTVTKFGSTKIAEIRIVKGGEFGDLYAYDFERDANGNIMQDENGSPIATSDFVKVGNPNSPVALGWSNTLTYKNLTLNFLIDGRIGGKVISFTESALDGYGRSMRSSDDRDKGSVEFEGSVVASNSDQIQYWYRGISAIGSNYVYNATNFRIRELSLGYDIPVSFAGGKIKKINVALFGRNLMFLYKDAPFDPEISAGTTTGLQGIEGLSMPSTRSFGFSLKATF